MAAIGAKRTLAGLARMTVFDPKRTFRAGKCRAGRFAGQNVVATRDMPHEFSEASATGNSPGASWHVKGSGDFDDGGKSDIL